MWNIFLCAWYGRRPFQWWSAVSLKRINVCFVWRLKIMFALVGHSTFFSLIKNWKGYCTSHVSLQGNFIFNYSFKLYVLYCFSLMRHRSKAGAVRCVVDDDLDLDDDGMDYNFTAVDILLLYSKFYIISTQFFRTVKMTM